MRRPAIGDNGKRTVFSFIEIRRLMSIYLVWGVAIGMYAVLTSQLAAAAGNKKMSDRELAVKECSACHYFYSNNYLPAYSWKKIIDNLSNHFGEDASLGEASRKRILSYMVNNRSMEIPIRITDTSWWKRIHGPGVFRYAKKKSIKIFECGKCHR